MPLPTSLEAAQSLADTFKSVISTSYTAEVYTLLLTTFFYFQVWHIPLTWVIAILCGACMPTLLESGMSTHLLNVLGVYCNHYLSIWFLDRVVKESSRLQAHLRQIEEQIDRIGVEKTMLCMVSLRLFPGSPNPIYNLLFPHIATISLSQNLFGVLVG